MAFMDRFNKNALPDDEKDKIIKEIEELNEKNKNKDVTQLYYLEKQLELMNKLMKCKLSFSERASASQAIVMLKQGIFIYKQASKFLPKSKK